VLYPDTHIYLAAHLEQEALKRNPDALRASTAYCNQLAIFHSLSYHSQQVKMSWYQPMCFRIHEFRRAMTPVLRRRGLAHNGRSLMILDSRVSIIDSLR